MSVNLLGAPVFRPREGEEDVQGIWYAAYAGVGVGM